MHIALATVDVLREIFGHMAIQSQCSRGDYLETQKKRQHLLWAALVCCTFLNPALDTLWRRMESLKPLLYLLPGFQRVENTFLLTGSISSATLSRFNSYAYRVREFEFTRDDRVHPSVYFRLSQLRQSPLIPRLRIFEWEDADPSTSEALLFITPTLSSVKIKIARRRTPGDDYALEAFVEALVDQVPLLKRFSLCGTIARNCFGSITKLRHLRSLHISGSAQAATMIGGLAVLLTEDMYYALPAMDSLTTLDISVDGLNTCSTFYKMQFKSLESIRLSGRFALIMPVIDSLSLNRLTSIGVCFVGTRSEDYRLFFRQLLNFPSLRKLAVEAPTSAWYLPIQSLVFTDVFGTLLMLKDLEDLNIILDSVTLAMDDENVESIALSWPKLKSLSLYLSMPEWKAPTIRCLACFARHCPALTDLSLPIHINASLEWEPPVFSHGLKLIHLVESPEQDGVQRTARILESLFPSLDLTVMMAQSWRSSVWKEVFDKMRSLRAAKCSNNQVS